MKYNFFQVIFKQICFKKIVNLPKRADFSILPFCRILIHALRFYGTNTQMSCFNVQKTLNLMQIIKCPILVVLMNP